MLKTLSSGTMSHFVRALILLVQCDLLVCMLFFFLFVRKTNLSLTLSLFASLCLRPPHTHTPCVWLRVSVWVCAAVCLSCDARRSPYGWLPDPSAPLGPQRTSAARGCDLRACRGRGGGQWGQALQAHYCRKLKTQSLAQTQVACALTPFVRPNCAIIKTNLEEDGASAWGKRKVGEKRREESNHHISHAVKQSHSVKLWKCVCGKGALLFCLYIFLLLLSHFPVPLVMLSFFLVVFCLVFVSDVLTGIFISMFTAVSFYS